MKKEQRKMLQKIQLLVFYAVKMQDEFLDAFLHGDGCSENMLCPAHNAVMIHQLLDDITDEFIGFCQSRQHAGSLNLDV